MHDIPPLVTTVGAFQKWVETADYGDVVYYKPTIRMMGEARVLFGKNKVILYQLRLGRKGDGHFVYCAQRVSDRAAGWLARMSHFTRAPFNRHAHEDQGNG